MNSHRLIRTAFQGASKRLGGASAQGAEVMVAMLLPVNLTALTLSVNLGKAIITYCVRLVSGIAKIANDTIGAKRKTINNGMF
jgi:hypothetical protein